MDFSIGNLNGTNANISSMISQLIAKKTSSMNSLLDQRTSIENALATLQNSSLGVGSINNSYSSQIASLQDTIDSMKEQYTINSNKLNTINSLNNSYKKTVSTLDDYIQSLKNPNQNDSIVSGTSSNGNVAGVTVGNSANPQRIELSVSQLATCSVLKSGVISGTSISGSTKITDLFAGKFDSASNTLTSLRTDISEGMKLSELGVKSGSFKLGSRVITVDSDETVGDLINKINSDSNYTAKIDKATGAFTISAKSGSSVAITNAVGDLNVNGNLTTTTKLEDIGVKSGAYFVNGVQIDVADGDTVGVLIDKLEAEGFNASIQTDTNNPSSKVLSITDSSGNKVSTEGTNFASAAGFTVSEGTFSINGETFTIESDTTIDDLLYQINKATDDGVGAIFKDGQIVLTASKTGAVEINVEKGSSNFTNAVGFTTGGVMNTGNLVMGSDGSYVTLKGLNSGIKGSDIAKADGSGKFGTGNFILSYSKIDSLGNATDEMLTTEIKVEDGDTIDDIIQKIKDQTSQKYTDSNGVERTNYLQAEIVDGHFQIRQTAKGADFDISVSAGSSDFTKYVGLTKDVGSGVSTSGSATTYTGVNAVTSSTNFSEGSFKITASLANDPANTQTVTIEVGKDETLQSVMDKINNSGLAIKAQLVTTSDGTQRLQLSHNNYGSGYQISVEAGDTNFTNVVGFTTTVSTGVSSDGSSSTLTGTVTGLNKNTTGYKEGSFAILTNKLSSDGKTASSEMVSATIEVDSSMSLQDIMDKINSATYKDASGKDVDLGLRASLTSDGRIQISQIHGGEGFDIKVEAGGTDFTQEVGLTKDVTVGVSTGSTSSYLMGTKVYNGTFTEGSFKISTNKVGDDGKASSEMISVNVNIEAGKTLAQQLDSINAQLNTIGLSASIVADGANAGKIKIEQQNSGAGFDIQVEAGSTDFTEKLGLTTQVSTGISNDGTFAYVLGKNDLSNTTGYTAGDFTVATNKTDAEGNPLDEMQSVTVTLQAGLSAQDAVNSINNQISSIGLSAAIEDGKIKISQTNAGSGFNIKIEGGSTNFTEKAGLTKDVSVGTSTEGTATKIVGNKNVTASQNGFAQGSFTITSGKTGEGAAATIDITSTDTIQSVINKINNSGIGVNAYIDTNGKFVIQQENAGPDYFITVDSGNTDFTQKVGITANVTTGVSNEAQNATLTGAIGNLNTGMTFTEGEFVITTNDVTHGSQEGYFADTDKFLSTTISVAEGDTLQNVIDKINQQGASIGISASLTSDGKIQLSQLNGGSGFTISVSAGSTDFTEKVGLTAAVTAGTSSNGSLTSITGTNTVSGTDTAGVTHIDRDTAFSMGYTAVSNATELVDAITSGKDKIMLVDNIDMSGVDYNPSSVGFSGVFDGNGYYISNLTINGTDKTGGLFGDLHNAVVRDLGFVNADIDAMGAVGVLATIASNTTISNVYVKDSSLNVVAAAYGAGGLIGVSYGDLTINNVVVENTSIGGKATALGGILGGSNDGDTTVFNSAVIDVEFTKGDVTTMIGGIAGATTNISVANSLVNFEYTGAAVDFSGSIIGTIGTNAISNFENVVSLSNLSAIGANDSSQIMNNIIEELSYNDFDSIATELSGLKVVEDDTEASGYRVTNTVLENSLGEMTSADVKFSTGDFSITAGKIGNEMTVKINVESGDTINDIIDKINASGLDITASINADGKFTITSNSASPDFRIKVESGSSDFLAYAGMASAVQNTGILTPGSDENQFTTLTGSANLDNGDVAITSGSFKINDVTINLSGNINNAIAQINAQTGKTGVIAELVKNESGKYNVVLRADKTGSNTTIYVEGGTSDFGVVAGLTTQSVGGGAALGTEGVKQTITGSKDIVCKLTEEEAIAQGYTVIHNAEEFLNKISANSTGGKFMLMDNIDLSTISYTPVANFSGTLDGNGYTISNLDSDSGLFNNITGAIIQNINIENFNISNNVHAGFLANTTGGNINIKNIKVTGSNAEADQSAGLIGYLTASNGYLNFNNIYISSDTTIVGRTYTGSILGLAPSIYGQGLSMSISNVESYANYDGSNLQPNVSQGGLIGSSGFAALNIKNVYFGGTFSTMADKTGGLVGTIDASRTTINLNVHNVFINPNVNTTLFSKVSNSIYDEKSGSYSINTNYKNINYSTDFSTGIDNNVYHPFASDEFDSLYTRNQFYSSPYTQISAGTININGKNITLAAGSVEAAVDLINMNSAVYGLGVTASIKDGRVVFTGDSSFTIAEGTSDFVQKTGTAGYTINKATESTLGETVTGTADIGKISEAEAKALGYTVVRNASDLKKALENNQNVMLMADINLSSLHFSVSNYSGVLNGNGYSIKSATNTLFSSTTDGAVIKNLKISGFDVTSGAGPGSLLVNQVNGSITFENIEVTNSTLASHYTYAGVLAGTVTAGSAVFRNIRVDGSVSITGDLGSEATSVGGLAGSINSGDVLVENTEVYASVAGLNYVGGIFGEIGGTNESVVFNNVKSAGAISTQNNQYDFTAGGFVGKTITDITFIDSYAGVTWDVSDYVSSPTAGAPDSPRDPSLINQFVGTSYHLSSDVHTFKNSYYFSSKFDATGEIGTEAANESTISNYTAFDENWASRKISLTEEEAIALGYTVIHDASEFRSKISTDTDGKFMLVGDIDLSTVSSYTSILNFSGTLDGNGYTIKNLTKSNVRGLFNLTQDGATFKNLTIDNIHLTYDSVDTGLIVGLANGDFTFDNIVVQNSSVDALGAGSLVGSVNYSADPIIGTINNVYVDKMVTLTGYQMAGGLMGSFSWSNASADGSHLYINNVSSYANIVQTNTIMSFADGRQGAGGLIGSTGVDTTISNVRVGGNISAYAYSGGVLGGVYSATQNTSKVSINISNAFSTAYIYNPMAGSSGSYSTTDGIIGMTNGNITNPSFISVNVSNSFYSSMSSAFSNKYGTYDTSTAALAQKEIFFDPQYLTFWEMNPNTDPNTLVAINPFDITINNVSIDLENGDNINTVVAKINEQSSSTNVTAKIVDGRIELSSDEKFTVSSETGTGTYYTSDFMKQMGITGGEYGRNVLTGSVTGLTRNTLLDGLTAGSFKIFSQNSSYTLNINIIANSTIGTIIDQINNSSTNFVAGLDSEGRFYIEDLHPKTVASLETPKFNVDFANTNFENLVGLGSYSTTFEDESEKTVHSTLTGLNTVTGNETLDSGTFTLTYGSKSQNFTVTQGETINSVLDKINASSLGVTATLNIWNGGKIVITANDESPDVIGLKEVSGNFGTVSGLTTVTNYGGESVVGHEGAYTTLTGKYEVSAPMTEDEAIAKGYLVVKSADDLKEVMTHYSNSGSTIILMNDIDLTGFSSIASFNGTIDGNGYTLKNYTGSDALIKKTTGDVTIKNLNIEGFDVAYTSSASANNKALLIGTAEYHVEIDSVNITDSSVSGLEYSGALVGYATGGVDINNICIDKDTLIKAGSHYSGGLVGLLNSSVDVTSSFSNIYSEATVDGWGEAGGIIGFGLSKVNYQNIYVGGTINASSTSGKLGGLAGHVDTTTYIHSGNNVVIDTDFLIAHAPVPSSGSHRVSITAYTPMGGPSNVYYNSDKTAGINLDTTKGEHALSTNDIQNSFTKSQFVEPKYTQITAGTININGRNIELSGGSIGAAINEINANSSKTGVIASVENGRVVFKNTDYGNKGITITAGTSSFVQATGTAGYTVSAPTAEVTGGSYTGRDVSGASGVDSSTHYTAEEAAAMGYTVVSTYEELMTALYENKAKIMLSGDIAFDSTIALPFTSVQNFSGILDGNGYTISGFEHSLIDSTSEGAIIRNFVVEGFNISSTDRALLVQRALGSVTFENIELRDSLLNSSAGGGTLVGMMGGSSTVLTVDNVFVDSSVVIDSSSGNIGGLIGTITSSGGHAYFTDVTANAEISGSTNLGGIVGNSYASLYFNNVVSEGSINSTRATTQLGGFVGVLASTQEKTIVFEDTIAQVLMTCNGGNADSDTVNQYIGHQANPEYHNIILDNAVYMQDGTLGYGGLDTGEIGTAKTEFIDTTDSGYTGLQQIKQARLSEELAISMGYTVIHNAQEFLDKIKADTDGKFILMNDIDFSNISNKQISTFKGTLDGNGFSIKNFTFESTAPSEYAGLFRHAYGAVIKNLTLDGFNITNEETVYTGALIGYAGNDDVTIENVKLINSNVSAKRTVGGLIGQVFNIDVNINNVFIDSTVNITSSVSGSSGAGGVIGSIRVSSDTAGSIIKNVISNANITSATAAAQIIGYLNDARAFIENVQTGGTVAGGNIGSVVGKATGVTGAIIDQAYTSTVLSPASGGTAGIFAGTFTGIIRRSGYNNSINPSISNYYGAAAAADNIPKTAVITPYTNPPEDKAFYQDVYSQISAGTVIINDVTITLEKGSISEAINKINEYTDQTGVKAYINEEGKVIFDSVPGSGKGVGIENGTSDFYKKAVTTSTTYNYVSSSIYNYTGSVSSLTLDSKIDGLTDGFLNINGVKVGYNSDMTVGEIIDAINKAGQDPNNGILPGYFEVPEFYAGLDDEGRVFVHSTSNNLAPYTTGNILQKLGLHKTVSTVADPSDIKLGYEEEYSTLTGTKTVNAKSDVSSGDFYINYNGNSQKITVGENENIQSVMDKITNAGIGVNASIQNGKVVITADEANRGRIYITDGTSNFSELAGFTTEGGQSGTTVKGKDSVYMSANTALSAQGLYSEGSFYVHLTDTNGDITDTVEINIGAGDSIQNIISKINNSGLGVTAYVDEDTGRLAIKRGSSSTAGGVLVTKGSSDFTSIIGFTSGGSQNVVATTGSEAELISKNTATNATFSAGNFVIQMTDKDGNVTSEHVFAVAEGDNAYKVAQMITDAGIGLTAYIDNATDKMVIKRDAASGEGGFIVQKGTSDFTTVMNFTSGGYEIGVKDDGENASITSLYNVASAGNFSAGTFYINGTEIAITEADLNSADKVQAILDKITELTDVIATLDNQNRIVLTKKASAGAGEIEIVKGTSDFTTKFGFTSGGYQNATVTSGTNATITSGITSYNTQVTAGDFYLQLTGDNASNPIKVTVDDGDTVGSIIDKINAMDIGINAAWDSSANKIVLTRDPEKGEGAINVIKGTSDFTNLVGFTSGGQQDASVVNGNTASITSSNQVGPDTAVSKGNFIIKFNGTEHKIELTDDTTVESVIEKINNIDGLSAVYDDTTKKITISRDGDSGEGNFEIIKGTSNFTTVAGFTSGGTQSSSAIRGSKASITSTNFVNDSQKFTQGDFIINLTGENAASIKVNIDANDTISSVIDKINDLDAGVTASYDNATGLITISRDAETGDGTIEIVKGSSNFTNVVGFTAGGSTSAVFTDGEYAEITAQKTVPSNQHFGAGDFTIKLTGDNASSITVDVTENDTMQSIIDKINAADAGVTAYLNENDRLVIKRDADKGTGGIEIVKGSSSFTSDIGLTTGGDEYSGIHSAGQTAKIISKQDVATAQGSYTSGNFFIQMFDKDGNAEAGGLIQIDINQSGNTVDDINTIINNINSKNAGITASIENGKLVLTRDQSLDAGSFAVIKGTSDFTNVIGITTGGSLESGVYQSGDAATHTVLTSQDLGKKLVSDSMTLGSIGVKTGTFRINGVDINVKSSDTIYDLVSRINSVFSDPKYDGIAVTASYENGEMVLRSKEASETARITVEKGTSNFTDIAQFTNAYQNSSDLGIVNEGHNAHFTLNGKEYDMALDLNDITDDNVYNGNNLIYLDEDGNVVTSADDASITIEVKQTGNTTIDIGRNLLNDSVEKLQSFVNRFNTAMNAAANPIMSDDTEFNTFLNQIKSALTNNIGSMNKITQKLADIGIVVKITGGTNSNMGTVEMSLSKTNGQYDYVEAFYKDPQKIFDLIIGDDSNPLDYSVAGSFVRLSDTLHYALENNRGGYFKVTPRSMEAQQKALKREITKTTFDLNELKNTAAGDNGMQGLSEYLLQLEQQYQLINEAILALNNQYSSSITRLVLNKNNSSFNPIVS